MKRVKQNQYDVQGQTRFSYQAGLKRLFAACHEPLPLEMEQLLNRLEKFEKDRADYGIFRH